MRIFHCLLNYSFFSLSFFFFFFYSFLFFFFFLRSNFGTRSTGFTQYEIPRQCYSDMIDVTQNYANFSLFMKSLFLFLPFLFFLLYMFLFLFWGVAYALRLLRSKSTKGFYTIRNIRQLVLQLWNVTFYNFGNLMVFKIFFLSSNCQYCILLTPSSQKRKNLSKVSSYSTKLELAQRYP